MIGIGRAMTPTMCLMVEGEDVLMMRSVVNAARQTKWFAREVVEKMAVVTDNYKHGKVFYVR